MLGNYPPSLVRVDEGSKGITKREGIGGSDLEEVIKELRFIGGKINLETLRGHNWTIENGKDVSKANCGLGEKEKKVH